MDIRIEETTTTNTLTATYVTSSQGKRIDVIVWLPFLCLISPSLSSFSTSCSQLVLFDSLSQLLFNDSLKLRNGVFVEAKADSESMDEAPGGILARWVPG